MSTKWEKMTALFRGLIVGLQRFHVGDQSLFGTGARHARLLRERMPLPALVRHPEGETEQS